MKERNRWNEYNGEKVRSRCTAFKFISLQIKLNAFLKSSFRIYSTVRT